jgi:aryl-alcohol dehydrogenase-like predicted oxidoreductase
MKAREFGNTGMQVTAIGFGAMTIGGAFGPVDDAESMQALHAAIDAGMNFIDTSNAYGEGRSETLIGRFLEERSDRDRILVFTKGGNNMVTRVRDFTPAYIAQCLEDSLERLGREPDLYMLHNPSVDNMRAEDSYAVLEKAKDEGKIRHWGVSVNTVPECELAVSQGRAASLQMEYNVLNRSAEEAFAHASAAGTAVISRVPLNRGFLGGHIDENVQFSEGDTRARSLTPENIRRFQGRLEQLKVLAAELGITPAAAQARQNAASCEPLPAPVLEALRA